MRAPSADEAERLLIGRYGEYSPKELLDLARACGRRDHPIAYSGFITVNGRITGDIDDEHVEVFIQYVLRRPDVDRINWTEYHRSGLIRLGAMSARMPEIYAEIFGAPTAEQLRAMRELGTRGRREAILFRWTIRDSELHEGIGFAQLEKELQGRFGRSVSPTR